MNDFAYYRAADARIALQVIGQDSRARFLAGGTNLLDLMREGIEAPPSLVDITRLPLDRIEELPDGGLRIGALVKNSHLASHALVGERYPLLAQAILAGASAQLRNMATTGGNVMQRTRCYYFYDSVARCNKRTPGVGCDAIDGFNRIHAVLGLSASDPSCIATHPSDMCVALTALDAVVRIESATGERTVPFGMFHRLAGDTPARDTNLEAGELITAVDLPALPFASRSRYRKVRDRASYAFALVSVGAALDLRDGHIVDSRIALGGVAHKPWRASRAEEHLRGKPAHADVFREAAERELEGATPFRHNGFKIELAKRTITQVLADLTADARMSS